MNDVHIRAILLIVIGVLSIGIAAGLKMFAGATGLGLALLFIVGVVAFVTAVWVLLFGEYSE